MPATVELRSELGLARYVNKVFAASDGLFLVLLPCSSPQYIPLLLPASADLGTLSHHIASLSAKLPERESYPSSNLRLETPCCNPSLGLSTANEMGSIKCN